MWQQLATLGAALLLAALLGMGVVIWWDHRGPDDVFSRVDPSLQAQRDSALAGERQLTVALNAQSQSLLAVAARGRTFIVAEGPGVTRYVQAEPAIAARLKVLAGPLPPETVTPADDLECAKMLAVDAQFQGTLR